MAMGVKMPKCQNAKNVNWHFDILTEIQECNSFQDDATNSFCHADIDIICLTRQSWDQAVLKTHLLGSGKIKHSLYSALCQRLNVRMSVRRSLTLKV